MTAQTAIKAAAKRLRPYVRHTPVIEIRPVTEIGGGCLSPNYAVKLKLELLQHTGSFKPLGAFNRLLNAAIPKSGVITATVARQ